MLSIVCETRVPSRTGKVSRMRPVRRESDSARAGSPRRAGRVADISTPIIVAEVTSRRRTGRLGSAARDDPVPGGGAEEEREGHQRAGDQHPAEVGADDAFDDVVDADLARGERGQADAEDPGDAEADRGARPGACRRSGPAAGRARAAAPAGTGGAPSAGRRPAQWATRSPARDRPRGLDRPLVDLGHLVGDPRPGVALGAARARPRPSRAAARARGRRAAAPRPAAAGRPGGTSTPSTPSVTTSL